VGWKTGGFLLTPNSEAQNLERYAPTRWRLGKRGRLPYQGPSDAVAPFRQPLRALLRPGHPAHRRLAALSINKEGRPFFLWCRDIPLRLVLSDDKRETRGRRPERIETGACTPRRKAADCPRHVGRRILECSLTLKSSGRELGGKGSRVVRSDTMALGQARTLALPGPIRCGRTISSAPASFTQARPSCASPACGLVHQQGGSAVLPAMSRHILLG